MLVAASCQRSGQVARVRGVSVIAESFADGPTGSGASRANDEHLRVEVSSAARDQDAEFAEFMASALPHLSRTAWFLCGDEHRAEELVQQALMKTYAAWPRARAGDPLAYARRTLANARIDSWRKHRLEQLTAPERLPDLLEPSEADAQADRDLLVRALATLGRRERQVVVLRYLVGLPEREVAHDLGVAVGTVKTTASRGLARLRDRLGHVMDERVDGRTAGPGEGMDR